VDEEARIAGVVGRLTASLGDDVDRQEVEAEVRRCFANWQDARVREFLPVLAEKAARDRLRLARH